jgi:cytoskeletal protein RodZ
MPVADLLRHERELRGLTLQQLSDETRIPLARLAAFEDPQRPADGGFYQRAQLRAYASALRLDERAVLEQLNRDLRPASPHPVSPQPETRRGLRAHLSPSMVAFSCIAALGGTAIALLSRAPQPASAVPEGRQSPAVASPSVATAGIVEPVPAAPAPTGDRPQASPGVPAVATAPIVTQLVVTSNPEGARVTVDGIGWGVTPVTIRHLPAGRKRVRLTSDGYAASERMVTVHPDRASEISVQLTPASPSD